MNRRPQKSIVAAREYGAYLRWLAVLSIMGSGGGCVESLAGDAELEIAERSSDKARYHLFNPTPRAAMRELSADRPDRTDCPFTVDAGHFQLELDFANLTLDQSDPSGGRERLKAADVAPLNFKVGLLNNLDFQLLFTPYRWERTDDAGSGASVRRSGFDGITPRFKLNLVGNDGGWFALALMPFVHLPVSQDHLSDSSVEGGLGIPFAFDIPGWDLGLQTTFRANRDASGRGYHGEFDNSVSLGHALVGRLSLAAEFFSSVSTENGTGWIGTFDTWVTYQLTSDLRLDGGVYIGVTEAADDWHPFLGLTWRF